MGAGVDVPDANGMVSGDVGVSANEAKKASVCELEKSDWGVLANLTAPAMSPSAFF